MRPSPRSSSACVLARPSAECTVCPARRRISATTSRTSASSSTRSTTRLEAAGATAGGATGAGTGASAHGRHRCIVVPWPGVEAAVIRPPACSAMPRQIDSPRPVPWPGPLVVKNGSNACCRTSSGMPCPLSETRSTTQWPGPGAMPLSPAGTVSRSVATTRRPPVGIASRAFSARFSTTCATSAWPISTVAGAASNCQSTSMVSPTVPSTIDARSPSATLRSTTDARAGFLPAKVSRPEVMCVASATERRSVSIRCIRWPCGASSSARASRWPCITVSRLLNS